MANHKHGESWPVKTKEYRTWISMKLRCHPKSKDAERYWNRGIRVCEKWMKSYDTFLKDMGRSPTPEHEIDRIDNDGNYEPTNCRWATRKENGNNKRNNHFYWLNEKRYNIREFAALLKCNTATIWAREKQGWSIDQIAEHYRKRIPYVIIPTYTLGRETHSIVEWSNRFGCSRQTLLRRFREGATFEQIANRYGVRQ